VRGGLCGALTLVFSLASLYYLIYEGNADRSIMFAVLANTWFILAKMDK